MAEDLGDDWWVKDVNKDSVSNNENPDEVKISKEEKKKARRKKRKIADTIDTNLMSSQDDITSQLSDILGLVQKEEITDWIQKASVRLDNEQTWPDFLQENDKNETLWSSNKPLVIVAASGIRCMDILRSTKDYKDKEKQGKTAKLFAKHLKLKDQIGRLKAGNTLYGVGTASRIEKLMKEGALKPKTLVLDFNFRNGKRQRLIDEKEAKIQLVDLLGLFVDEKMRNETRLLIY